MIVVDDASATPDRRARSAASARRGRGGAQRRPRAARNELVALLDSDTVPQPGWLEPLLAHFNDPEVDIVAPRIVALEQTGRLGRYEARRSPLDRGPEAARVVPHGRVPFVPGAALLVRRHVRFDETFDPRRGGRRPGVAHAVRPLRAGGAGRARAPDRPARVARDGASTTAGPPRRSPSATRGHARPLHVSPWTTAAWAALLREAPGTALAITATATALLARDVRPRTAFELARRHAAVRPRRRRRPRAPLVAARASPTPRTRLAFAPSPRWPSLDDLAFGTGVWLGCVEHRTLAPLLPATAVEACASSSVRLRAPMKKWVVIALWLIAAAIAFPFQSKLQALASDESDAFKDHGAESTQVAGHHRPHASTSGNETTAVVVYTRTRRRSERRVADAEQLCDKRIPDLVRGSLDYRVRRAAAGTRCARSRPDQAASQDQHHAAARPSTSDDATETVVRDVAPSATIVPPDDGAT